MKTDELTIVGLIFSGIVFTGMWIDSNIKSNNTILMLQENYLQAMSLTIELDEENKSLHSALISMNSAYDELQDDTSSLAKLIQIKDELRSIQY